LRKPALLAGADMQDAELPKVALYKGNLPDTNLKGANLAAAVLIDANFSAEEKVGEGIQEITADLTKADLSKPALQGANLSGCPLDDATLTDATLQSADLSRAELTGADLTVANLTDADLSDADLSEARGWTMEQLTAARPLEGATMPNGQKYEDWLKGRGENGENSGAW
jgi:uncharacterized protein YjbI with pentapeptide repeats